MPHVVVDGVSYAPADGSSHHLGISVSTRNRPEALAKTLSQIAKHTPSHVPVVVVDDASDTPVEGAAFRFEENAGVARVKNKGIEILMGMGCTDLFLLDDDCHPIADGWYKPYIESPMPHLMWMFDKPKGEKNRQLEVLYEDDHHVAYHATRGCMLYFHRSAIERVGGMDPGFGLGNWEHVSLSDRIHSAGLTEFRYADVQGSESLMHSMDQHGEVKSTITDAARRFSEGPGMELRMESRHSDKYIEYRELEDVVLTALLCAQDDPQRGKKLPNGADQAKALVKSVHGRMVMLTTGIDGDLPNAEVVKVHQCINPYFQRWLSIFQWLRDNPTVGRVWCVDATDVTMIRSPWDEMELGRLYFGYEPTTLRDEWMVKSHPDTTLQNFMRDNPNLPLLNMGVVGGDRDLIMRFAHRMVKFYFDDEIDFIYGWETKRVGVGDMAAGNYIARSHFGDQVSSGPHVTNVFKSGKPSSTAWWAHK